MISTAFWLFNLVAVSGSSTALMAPPAVTDRLAVVKPIDRFASLPEAIRAGHFTVDGVSAAGWRMAERGGSFSATDVPVAGALCLVHYERVKGDF